MDNTIEFILMLMGAGLFWWIMWKLVDFVGDLVEYAYRHHISNKEKK